MSIVLLITVCTAAVSQRLRINDVDSMDVEMHLGHGTWVMESCMEFRLNLLHITLQIAMLLSR